MKYKITLLCTGLLLTALQANAFTFTKNNLISDQQIRDSSYLSQSGIQSFLEQHGSVLSTTTVTDVDGQDRAVSGVIRRVATDYRLNPMLFLVLAQKESSAITQTAMTSSINDWILGFGRCDSCSVEQAAPYKGIAKQFESAAKQFDKGYLADLEAGNTTISGWKKSVSKTTIDGISVTPDNNATAALYTYNPCVGPYGGAGGYQQFGCNSLFQKLWQEWNPNIHYPNGSLLQVNGTVYLIQHGQRRAFRSRAALLTNYNIQNVVSVPVAVLEQYDEAAAIAFANGVLLRNPAGTIYVYTNGALRGIASQAAFRAIGYNPEEVLDVAWRDIQGLPEGKKITVADALGVTGLIQNASTGAVFNLDARGKLRPIIDRSVLENKFSSSSITAVSPADLEPYSEGYPARLQDGTLVTASGESAVYLISDGKRLRFSSAAAFDSYGYRWSAIETVPKSVLTLHKEGALITKPKPLTTTKKKSKKK